MKTKKTTADKTQYDLCIVGGAGHVGLPLALVYAAKLKNVLIYDINKDSLKKVAKGKMPFVEKGGQPMLAKALKSGRLHLTSDAALIKKAKAVVVTIGTPVDEFMNPDTKVMRHCFDDLIPHLKNGQLIVLRSTVYPGTTDWLDRYVKKHGKKLLISFCPERVVQGYAIEEVQKLPQIVSGVTKRAEDQAKAFFRTVAPQVVVLKPMEAEFAKLFSNAYRYIQFAISNQFYMIAHSAGLDFNRIIDGMKKDYSRAKDIPRAGLAAGPCLFKDTMQLAAFSDNQFSLGHTAVNINEGLVLFMVGQIERKFNLSQLTVGLLGMAFKAESDDTRSSLSYKLKKVLRYHAKDVLTTDPYVKTDKHLLPVNEVIRKSDILILCVPHKSYKRLKLGRKKVMDIWGFYDKGKVSVI